MWNIKTNAFFRDVFPPDIFVIISMVLISPERSLCEIESFLILPMKSMCKRRALK